VVEQCTLSRDGEVVLDGTFQIRRITKRYTNENEIVIYDVYLKSNNSDFYTIIDSRFLTDLDMSSYNHFHTKDVIINSMRNGTYLDGFQYFLSDVPVIEYPLNSYNFIHLYEPDDFKPATYVKTILDRIFLEAGFTYEFDELYENNIDKLIITTNREKIVPGIVGKLFRAGIDFSNGGAVDYATALWKYPNLNYPSPESGIPAGTILAPWVYVPGQNTGYAYDDYNWAPVEPELFQPPIIFDNDNSSELNLFDGAGAYDNVIGEYTLSPTEQSMYFETTFIINTWIKHELDMSPYGYLPNTVINMDEGFNEVGEIRLDTDNNFTFDSQGDWRTGNYFNISVQGNPNGASLSGDIRVRNNFSFVGNCIIRLNNFNLIDNNVKLIKIFNKNNLGSKENYKRSIISFENDDIDYIINLDSDCLLNKDWLIKLNQLINNFEHNIICSSFSCLYHHGNPFNYVKEIDDCYYERDTLNGLGVCFPKILIKEFKLETHKHFDEYLQFH
jgi:hypothetical protein